MKKKYNVNQQFFVVFAINERSKTFYSFKLSAIQNITLGLHDIIEKAPNNELSDGEIANALVASLENCIGDKHIYKSISLISWYAF